ncbi:PDZ domain-containing protein [Lentzea flaviverrucosa]|uniref:endopeptidase La n=1 Tax=Lentzea flaviverrucosa TaxID=200379 RepID=A0A1H9VET8_9PSEU|nr:PDZ domain-containing protein [Lentzea flaviverrucosa]SES20079.1 PDZ domain-containing protein [Lentzea flaviverrucosa]
MVVRCSAVSETVTTAPPPAPPPRERGLTRRTWTLIVSFLVVAALGLLGGFARVPYVALGPGPTYDVLGQVKDADVVSVEGQDTFPTKGTLRMTTVSLTDDVSLFGALGLWLSGRYALAPREEFFKPGESEQQVQENNERAFSESQTAAEVAALHHLKYPGMVIANQVTKGSPADNVIPLGARIISVNGKQVQSAADVSGALENTKPGDRIEVAFEKDGTSQSTQLTLGTRDDGRPAGFIGISPVDRADVPFKIKISLSDVGGPSAGLIFALAIVDKLTPGELNGGKSIAGTGEITGDGTVKPIGGIAFKMVAAKEAGATAFLVPADNCADAKQQAPSDLKLIKVENLTDAVSSLEALNAGKDTPSC